MANIGKKEIVKMLLKNKELENEDEEQLMEILFNEPIAIDVDKASLEDETWKDRLADAVRQQKMCTDDDSLRNRRRGTYTSPLER